MQRPCTRCGTSTEWPPLCFGADAPWRGLGVSDSDFAKRVELTKDQCVVDEKHFFIRGHIEIPVHDLGETFAWSVWCSLSEDSFLHVTDRWNDPDRINDSPRFGWLQTSVPGYPETVPTKTMVHSREVGAVPFVEVDPEHALGREQQAGMTLARLWELTRIVMGTEEPLCPTCARAR